MNEPIYGCAGCQNTAGAGGCPVHGQRVNVAPVPDWNKMFPDLSAKYSDLLQSHSSLCGEIEQKSAYIRELSDALEETRKERDKNLLQNDEYRKALLCIAMATSNPSIDGATYRLDNVLKEIANRALSEKPKCEVCGEPSTNPICDECIPDAEPNGPNV